MGDHTGIEWTDATWNPLAGCEHASPGCDGCYAAREAAGRLSGHPVYAGLAVRNAGPTPHVVSAGRLWDGQARFTGEIRLLPERLDQPRRWRKPRRIFVNSMSDLFHPDVPEHFIRDVFATMADCPQHTFQVLTKRPQRMGTILRSPAFWFDVWADRPGRIPTYLPNVWIGSSIESDRYTFRADHLRRTPAAVRFVSAEPLLGPLPSLSLDGIGWLIAGGESGPQARPTHPDWVRDLRDRCIIGGTEFLFKQWGEWLPDDHVVQHAALPDGRLHEAAAADVWRAWRVGKKLAGRTLDGRTWDEYPDA